VGYFKIREKVNNGCKELHACRAGMIVDIDRVERRKGAISAMQIINN